MRSKLLAIAALSLALPSASEAPAKEGPRVEKAAGDIDLTACFVGNADDKGARKALKFLEAWSTRNAAFRAELFPDSAPDSSCSAPCRTCGAADASCCCRRACSLWRASP